MKEIKRSELKSIVSKELYYECYECPNCNFKKMSINDNYCSKCGLKVVDDIAQNSCFIVLSPDYRIIYGCFSTMDKANKYCGANNSLRIQKLNIV